jgi:hypothetical protein
MNTHCSFPGAATVGETELLMGNNPMFMHVPSRSFSRTARDVRLENMGEEAAPVERVGVFWKPKFL